MRPRLTPDARRVHAFVRNAMRWIVRHLDAFDPFLQGQEYDIKRGQRVGELAILLRAYTALTNRRDSPEVRRIAALLEGVQRQRAFSDRLVRSPHEFILFAELYSSLRAFGIESIEHRRLLETVVRAGYLNFTERLPHRVMDVASCLRIAGVASPLPSLKTLYRRSILWPVPCPIFLDEDASYFLTHVVMFAFDFGTRPASQLPLSHRLDLHDALSALIVSMCQEHHWDLLAELLLCWDCVGLGPAQVYRRGWTELMEQQRENGAVPGPEWALRLLRNSPDQSNTTRGEPFNVDHHYHTTLVSIIAGCACLRRLREPSPSHTWGHRNRARAIRGLRPSLINGFYTSVDVVAALRSASEWLMHLLDKPGIQANTSMLCAALMGVWIASTATGASRTRFGRFARKIGADLAETEAEGPLDWSQTPATLKIVTAAVLREQGFHIRTLHGTNGFLARASQALTLHAERREDFDPELDEKRLLFSQLGLLPQPRYLPFRALMRGYEAFRLSDDRKSVTRLSRYVNSHTMHGLRKPSTRVEYRQVTDTLAALATSRFRHYQLGDGCRLLRSAAYLGQGGRLVRTCSDYLLLNQRPDGTFGFLGAEERALGLRQNTAGGHDSDLDLYLPIALECMWTLAEVSLGWRLYGALPRQAT